MEEGSRNDSGVREDAAANRGTSSVPVTKLLRSPSPRGKKHNRAKTEQVDGAQDEVAMDNSEEAVTIEPKGKVKGAAPKNARPRARRAPAAPNKYRRQSYALPAPVVQSFELEINEPESPSDMEGGPGKYPKRTRQAPFKYWRGERPVYKANEPNTYAKGIRFNTPSPAQGKKRVREEKVEDDDQAATTPTPPKRQKKSKA